MSRELFSDAYLDNWVQNNRDYLLGRLDELVSIPSENLAPNGNELPVQTYLLQVLSELGLAAEQYDLSSVKGLESHAAYWPGRNYKHRPNVYAVKKGSGDGRSLIFSMHADVVVGMPGVIAPDPFQPVIRDGRFYGRGSNDMKGGTAAVLTALRFLQEHGIGLRGDLSFESVVDEEMGGANGTLAGRLRGNRADAAIIPEPTNMRVCASHLGGATWRIKVHGKGGMGFGGEEVRNPVYGMAQIVQTIERYQREMQARKQYVEPTGESRSPGVVLSMIHAGSFEPGMADGIPETCFIEVWIECLPGESFPALEEEFMGPIRELCSQPSMSGFRIEWENITRFLHGSRGESELTDILLGLTQKECGFPAGAYTAPFACDAFLFNDYSDTPAIVLGPSGENAHAPDEFVDIDSLLKLTKIYIAAIKEWCGVEYEGGNG